MAGPWGHYRWVRHRPPPSLKMALMAGPLGALPVGSAGSTIEFEDDIDGGPPGRYCRWVRQHLPPSFEDDVDDGPPGGVADRSGIVHHRG
jgi:hypothetical protein